MSGNDSWVPFVLLRCGSWNKLLTGFGLLVADCFPPPSPIDVSFLSWLVCSVYLKCQGVRSLCVGSWEDVRVLHCDPTAVISWDKLNASTQWRLMKSLRSPSLKHVTLSFISSMLQLLYLVICYLFISLKLKPHWCWVLSLWFEPSSRKYPIYNKATCIIRPTSNTQTGGVQNTAWQPGCLKTDYDTSLSDSWSDEMQRPDI